MITQLAFIAIGGYPLFCPCIHGASQSFWKCSFVRYLELCAGHFPRLPRRGRSPKRRDVRRQTPNRTTTLPFFPNGYAIVRPCPLVVAVRRSRTRYLGYFALFSFAEQSTREAPSHLFGRALGPERNTPNTYRLYR